MNNYLFTHITAQLLLKLRFRTGHDLSGLWRYRFENYRVVARIEDQQFIVLVLKVGHRKDIYE